MKHLKFIIFSILITSLSVCNNINAQDSIVVFSDTTDNAYQEDYKESTYHASPDNFMPDGFLPDDFFHFENIENERNGFIDLLFGMGVFALIAFIFSFILLPLALIILLVYLIYRSCRIKKDKRYIYGTKEEKIYLVKQQSVRLASWGAVLIIGELIMDWSNMFYLAGLILLGIAAVKWWESKNM